MSSSRRRYSREFKLEVIRRVHETGQSQAQVAEDLGISANTLSRWMKQARLARRGFVQQPKVQCWHCGNFDWTCSVVVRFG